MKDDDKCPKCGGNFEMGIIADRGEASLKELAQWAKKIAWHGATLENAVDIKSYRCEKCGYLENYAK